jgi:hypothetical protein
MYLIRLKRASVREQEKLNVPLPIHPKNVAEIAQWSIPRLAFRQMT